MYLDISPLYSLRLVCPTTFIMLFLFILLAVFASLQYIYMFHQSGLNADEWLRAALEACGGRGGGRPTSAQGQAASAAEMDKAIAAAKSFAA